MEPGTATIGASQAAKFLTAIKDLPLWLLTATALALTLFFVMPAFNGMVSKETQTWVALAACTFAIFAVCRFASVLIAHIRVYQAGLNARRTFHLTPVAQQCHWGSTEQADKTVVTQIAVRMIAKNSGSTALHLLTAQLIRPKIRGEVLNNILLIEDRLSGEYGSVHVTGKHIPPGAVRSIAVNILIRGVPKRRPGKERRLSVVLAVDDAEGNQQRVRLDLRSFDPNATVPGA